MTRKRWSLVLDALVLALVAALVYAALLAGCVVMPAACWVSGG